MDADSTTDEMSRRQEDPWSDTSIENTVLDPDKCSNEDLPVSDVVGPAITAETNSSTNCIFTGSEETSEISTADAKSSLIPQQPSTVDGDGDLSVFSTIGLAVTKTNSSTRCEDGSKISTADSTSSSNTDKTILESVIGSNGSPASGKAESINDNENISKCLPEDRTSRSLLARASEIFDLPSIVVTEGFKVPTVSHAAGDVLDSSNCPLGDKSRLSDDVAPNRTPATMLLETAAGNEEKMSVSSSTKNSKSNTDAGNCVNTGESQKNKELYSEIIITSAREKILRKYFGDSRRPGICHKPHHKGNYGSFKCTECNQSFSYLPSLLLHRNKHGQKHFVYECSKCSYRSPIPGAYTQHEYTSHKDNLYQCHICDVTFLQRSTLNRHRVGTGVSKQVSKQARRHKQRFVCKLCDIILSNRSALTVHLQQKHMDTLPKDSSKCIDSDVACNNDAFFDDTAREQGQQHTGIPNEHAEELQHHPQTVDETVGQTQRNCRWCDFTATSTFELVGHKKKKHFSCLICDQSHTDGDTLEQHMQRFHRKVVNETSNQATKWPCRSQHECPTCKTTFLSLCDLNAHLKTHNEVGNPAGTADTDPVKHWYCVTCNVIFPSKRLLDLHVSLNHQPTKAAESNPNSPENVPTENQEWRCLLCNTLYQTLLECKKHQAMHHPDEYQYCRHSDIARPAEPSELSESGTRSSYKCNMCDGKYSSLNDLHGHKKQFHKIAYSMSVSDEQETRKGAYKCRFECGFTDVRCKVVAKHESSCVLKRPRVFNPVTGKLVQKTTAHLLTDDSSRMNLDKIEENGDHIRDSSACLDRVDQPATSDALKAEATNTQKLAKPKLEPDTMPGPRSSTVGFITESSAVIKSSAAITKPSASFRTGISQKVKLPVYGKHDHISSSSEDESDCSWFDKSSGSSDGNAREDDMDTASIFSDEDEKEGGTNNSENESVTTFSGDEGQDELSRAAPSPANVQKTQLPQNKPAAAPSNSCPPLLQPTVLMRFFQAIDMSDLYRLALQMITGSPQPHALPTADPAMVPSKMAHFKYKIPLGYSHKDFQEMPLFPSSKEAMRIHCLQTLPTNLLKKYYKGVLAKPCRHYLSTMVDSAVINYFHDNTLKVTERYVKKQRADDRKDITLSLSKYIVSQYVKNQQKKGPSIQPTSLLGVKPTTLGNSSGAGPSSVNRQPSTIQLFITPTTQQGSSVPVATVKRAVLLSQGANASSCRIQNNSRGSIKTKVPVIYKVISPSCTSATSTHPPTTSTTSCKLARDHAKSAGGKPSEETSTPQEKSTNEANSCSEAIKSKKEAKAIKRTLPVHYSVPVRRSARLLQSPEQQPSSVSVGDDNGFAGSFTSEVQIVKQNPSDCNDSIEGKTSKAPKRTKYDAQNGASDCDSRNQDCQNGDELKRKSNSNRVHCKDGKLNCTQDNESGAKSPKSTSQFAERFQTLSTAGTKCSSVSQSSETDVLQHVPVTELHAGNVPSKYDARLHIPRISSAVLHDEMLVNTIERDGVIHMRSSRPPLHGLNGYRNTLQGQMSRETFVVRWPMNVQMPECLTKNKWKKTISKFEVVNQMVNKKTKKQVPYKLTALTTNQMENETAEKSVMSKEIIGCPEVDSSYKKDDISDVNTSVYLPHQASEKIRCLDSRAGLENSKEDAVKLSEEGTESLAVTRPTSIDYSSKENAKTQTSGFNCLEQDELTRKINLGPKEKSSKTLESFLDLEPSEETSPGVNPSSKNTDTEETQMDRTKTELVRTTKECACNPQSDVFESPEEVMAAPRMLRSNILKRTGSSTSEIKKKKQKTTETPKLKSSGRSGHSTPLKSPEKNNSKLGIHCDHSYSASRQHWCSQRVNTSLGEYDARDTDCSPLGRHDESYSAAFAMDHCYVRLIPMDLACRWRRNGGNVELLPSDQWASSREIETCEAPSLKLGKRESDDSATDKATPGRQLRPRDVDFKYT